MRPSESSCRCSRPEGRSVEPDWGYATDICPTGRSVPPPDVPGRKEALVSEVRNAADEVNALAERFWNGVLELSPITATVLGYEQG